VQPNRSSPPRSEQVAPFLRERRWRVAASSIAPIAHGEWSRAFHFTLESGAEYVVRFGALNDFRKDEIAARYATPDLPIPRIVEIGEAFDSFYAISERAHGAFLDALDANQLRSALLSLWAAIDSMRLSALSGAGFGVWDGSGQAAHATWRDALLAVGTDAPDLRIAGWRRRLEQSPTGAEPFNTAFRRLAELALEVPDARHLIHADLLNYNVLVDRQRVSAVLDWGAAMYGDWVFDVAWFAFWQPWYPAWSGIDFAAEAVRYFTSVGADLAEFKARLRCCEVFIGLDNQAYCAFKGESRWPQLERVAQRTIELACSRC
jgi:hygromycin-B 4-O-kinase